jgi:hypothetical protein
VGNNSEHSSDVTVATTSNPTNAMMMFSQAQKKVHTIMQECICNVSPLLEANAHLMNKITDDVESYFK